MAAVTLARTRDLIRSRTNNRRRFTDDRGGVWEAVAARDAAPDRSFTIPRLYFRSLSDPDAPRVLGPLGHLEDLSDPQLRASLETAFEDTPAVGASDPRGHVESRAAHVDAQAVHAHSGAPGADDDVDSAENAIDGESTPDALDTMAVEDGAQAIALPTLGHPEIAAERDHDMKMVTGVTAVAVPGQWLPDLDEEFELIQESGDR